jgi:hypothetical protein
MPRPRAPDTRLTTRASNDVRAPKALRSISTSAPESLHAPHPHATNDPSLDPRRPENSPPTRSTHPGVQDRPGTQALRIRRPPEGIFIGREPPLALTALPNTHIDRVPARDQHPLWSGRTISRQQIPSTSSRWPFRYPHQSIEAPRIDQRRSFLAATIHHRPAATLLGPQPNRMTHAHA